MKKLLRLLSAVALLLVQMRKNRLFALATLRGLIAVLMVSALAAALVAATSVVIVSFDGQHQWHSRVTDGIGTPDPSYGSVTFVTGPSVPPRGTGSLRLQTNPGKGDGSAQMRSTAYAGVLLTNLTELTYYAYSAANNGQQFPFLSLDVICSGCPDGGDRLFFEPPYQQPFTGNPSCPNQGPTVMFSWQTWDALNGCWWDNNGELGGGGLLGVQPLSVFTSNHPDARISNPNGVGGLRLAVGFASNFDNFDGNIDMVSVGVKGNTTSYDFEPASGCRRGHGDGDFDDDKDHHKHHAHVDHDSCKHDDKHDVEEDNLDSGRHFESTSVDSATFTSDANSQALTMTGTGLHDGLPVGFTMIAVDKGALVPGLFLLVLTDGYSTAGSVPAGAFVID
jgi:hypothetical protein